MPEYDSYIRDSGLRPSDVKVVVAMSGGVDSSIAAALLARDGYNVAGVTFELWRLGADRRGTRSFRAVRSVEDARAVCRALDIPHYVMDLRSEFKSAVVEPFCREYLAGRTPNPCVLCNAGIKFAALMSKARDIGALFISTGHHVRQVGAANTGAYRLLKSIDPAKDQSYALWGLTQRYLKQTVFPVGWLTKGEVRGLARRLALPVAEKEESQDICFLAGGDIPGLLDEVLPGQTRPSSGEIRDLEENVIGCHKGYYNFTIGQRRGLSLARGRRQYIVKLDPVRNIVYVGGDDDLKCGVAYVSGFNMIESGAAERPCAAVRSEIPTSAVPRPETSPKAAGIGDPSGTWDASCEDPGGGPRLRVTAKIRYLHPGALGWLRIAGRGAALMSFDEPQRAITPGQSLVAYDGERLLGGGIIEKAEP